MHQLSNKSIWWNRLINERAIPKVSRKYLLFYFKMYGRKKHDEIKQKITLIKKHTRENQEHSVK